MEGVCLRDVLCRLASGQFADAEGLKKCEDFIEIKKRESPLNFLLELALILRDSDSESLAYSALIHIGLVLNRSRLLPVLRKQWVAAPVEARMAMRTMFTGLLGNASKKFRENGAYCLAGFVYLEYRSGLWPEFFDELFKLVSNPANGENSVEGCMFLICELFRRGFFKEEDRGEEIVREIFRVVFLYLSEQQTPMGLRPQLLSVVCTGMYAFDPVFADGSVLERVIHTLLLNFTLNDPCVHKKTYEALELVCVRHFRGLSDVLVGRLLEACARDLAATSDIDKDLGINFWMKFAGAASDNHNKDFVLQIAPKVVPLLLATLKDTREENEDIVQVKRSAMTCLLFIVNAGGQPVTPVILDFIDKNLASTDGIERKAALFAIYSNVELRDFYPILMQRFQVIVNMARETDNEDLQDAALFILSSSLGNYPQILESATQFNLLLDIVSKNMNRPIRIVQRCFELLYAIFNTFKGTERQSFLGTHFEPIWQLFLSGFSLREFRQPDFMTAFFESLNAFIMHLPEACEEHVGGILKNVIETVNREVRATIAPPNCFQFVAFMCSVISTIAARTRMFIEPYVDAIMDTLLFILRQHDCLIYEEALITVDSIALIMKEKFSKYHEAVMPFVMTGFETGDPRVICQASHLIGDMFDNPSPYLISFVDKVYDSVIRALDNPNIPVQMKPFLLNAFISVGAQKRRDYYQVFKDILIFVGSAQKAKIDVSQKDEVEFGYALYEAALRGYILAVEIYKDEKEILTNVPQMLQVIDHIMEYSFISLKIMDRFIKLLYRLVQICGKDVCVRYLNKRPSVKGLFDIVMESGHERLVENATKLLNEIQGQ